jgi:hypothetical protein
VLRVLFLPRFGRHENAVDEAKIVKRKKVALVMKTVFTYLGRSVTDKARMTNSEGDEGLLA